MDDLIDKAKARFGLRENCEFAGFILPSGEMLDFVHPNGRNQLWHKAIEDIMEGQYDKDDLLSASRDFIAETGSIRRIREGVRKNELDVDISVDHPITKRQLETLEECLCFSNIRSEKEIYFDFIKDRKIVQHGTLLTNGDSCFRIISKLKKTHDIKRRSL